MQGFARATLVAVVKLSELCHSPSGANAEPDTDEGDITSEALARENSLNDSWQGSTGNETYTDSSVERRYDAQSRLLRVEDSTGGDFAFTYDLVGRTTNATSPFGTVQYIYDEVGRVKARQVIGQPSNTTTTRWGISSKPPCRKPQ